MSLIFLLFLSLQLHLSPLSSSSTTTTSAARHLYAMASSCQSSTRSVRLSPNPNQRFLPPIDSAESCWVSYQTLINDFFLNFNDLRKICGFQTSWIAEGCMNITTRDEFEGNVSKSVLDDAVKTCNQSFGNGSPCASCTTSLSSLQPSNLNGGSIGNLSDCTAYPSIYAAAFINRFGPTDEGAANCLFGFDFSDLSNSNGRVRTIVICVVVIGCGERSKVDHERETNLAFGMNSINESTTLVRYTFDEIREATKNFSRLNIIGRDGYGNVYKGVLPDSSEVALKRFKNCSVGADAVFAHEVELLRRQFLPGGKTNIWKTPSSESESLNLWAQNSRFLIVWNYDGNKDSVVEVRKRYYITCNTSSPIAEHKVGNTNVKLDRSGPFYFINGEEGHCDKGQKLIVVVISAKLIWKLICVLFDIVSQIHFKRFVVRLKHFGL
ncbi:putative LRR receptor-like serine/threonine-protein kinase RKF3 [Camellia lanceoleosa]|uniref:LRR receptor-like serine/threonine-protein kinase RKF3 n=1 Tax=Camellia lanceoleosa TaxID=1840588 RepID=A0ACC0I7W2_9ERIC|nr:putative LRR receptor-like serine/threonine-protein kinase RKF3 [Camellia lanceoleosa]